MTRQFPARSRRRHAGDHAAVEPRKQDTSHTLARAMAEAVEGSAPEAEEGLRCIASHAGATLDQRSTALEALVELMWREGRHAECADLRRERLALPFDSPTRKLVAQLELAVCLVERGGLEEAVWNAAHWVAQSEAAGDASTYEGVRLRSAFADLLRMQGDLISAELHIGLALTAAERVGEPGARAAALWNAALVSADQSRFAEAAQLGREAVDLLRAAGGEAPTALVELVRVILLLDSRPSEAGKYPETDLEAACLETLNVIGAEFQQRHFWDELPRIGPAIPRPRDDRPDAGSSTPTSVGRPSPWRALSRLGARETP